MPKHALLVGINEYANSKFNLQGCLNDIESLAHLLISIYGFAEGDIEFLRDAAATRDNILSRLDALVSHPAPGDMLVFAYSGHGTQTLTTDVNEPDAKDECLVPYEASYTSLVKDNELYDLFNRRIQASVNFTAIYDCCHSGTLLRECGFDDTGMIVENVINRCLPVEDLLGNPVRSFEIGPYNILSACNDEETAADLRAAGPEKLPRGAFSYALHNFLGVTPGVPVALAEPQINAAIGNVSQHRQTPNYVVVDINGPLIRH